MKSTLEIKNGNNNGASQKAGIITILSGTKKVKPKNLHVTLKEEDSERLDWLKSKIEPHTQTAVIENSLQLLEAMLKDYENGAQFYIKKREGEIEEYDVFDRG